MEEEAPARRSVAELAGKFKGSSRPHDAAGNETQEKPVRRRPPRSLQLPKTHGEDQEQPSGVTSPLPAKAKRNSALIEKLQANLALSPTAMLPSPKSPGFRLLPPAFTPASTGPDPVSTETTSSTVTPTSPVTAVTPLTEEEGPASFEDPPTAAEGSILSNSSIKGRARHSLRRRPPSRRHRKTSSGDDVAIEGGDVSPSEKEAGEEVCEKESEVDESEKDKTSTCPEKNESHKEDESKISVESTGEDEEKKEGPVGGEEGDGASSGRKEEEEKEKEKEKEEEEKEKEEEEEKNSAEKQTEDTTEGAPNTDGKEEKNEETTS